MLAIRRAKLASTHGLPSVKAPAHLPSRPLQENPDPPTNVGATTTPTQLQLAVTPAAANSLPITCLLNLLQSSLPECPLWDGEDAGVSSGENSSGEWDCNANCRFSGGGARRRGLEIEIEGEGGWWGPGGMVAACWHVWIACAELTPPPILIWLFQTVLQVAAPSAACAIAMAVVMIASAR